jgi:hypothetical protein
MRKKDEKANARSSDIQRGFLQGTLYLTAVHTRGLTNY